jgi:hypothetical protein
MRLVLLSLTLLGTSAFCQVLDPTIDYRYTGSVARKLNGDTLRSSVIIAAFKKKWACPSNGAHIGSCPGWAIDHVVPLDCGGADAVWNMQWLPYEIKTKSGVFAKDRFERIVYGGNAMSKGCP